MDPRVLKAYDDWVADHFDQLVAKHAGKVIAVYRGRLIAVADSFKEVYAAAREQGIRECPFAMEVPTLQELEAIL